MIARHPAGAALSLVLAAALGFAAAWLLHGPRFSAAPPAASSRPGPVDIGFAQFMASHHDQAVTLCQIVLAHGHSRVRPIANTMLAAQLLEMGRLQGSLSLWGEPLTPTRRPMEWLLQGAVAPDAALLRYVADCRAAPGGMKGLATSEELNRLRELDGDAGDRLFLQLMIRHHAGALPMAEFAAHNAGTPMIRGVAGLDLIEQGQEVGVMQLLLEREFAP